ncbi:MAG TPA: aldo/keto reductase [Spirochaetia bacterium]|nr:aldo/keto reductase [Spirochaetia bacterium]
MMRRVYLGSTGLAVSELALGTQTFGWGADPETSWEMADRFVEEGGLLFDSSSTYGAGTSEKILGSWLKARGCRNSVVIATKVFFPTGTGVNDFGLSRRHLLQSVEESLTRLGTDHVDLYQAHCWDAATPLEETLRALDDLVRAGKVRYVGVSNFTASQLVRAVCLARSHGWSAPVSLQAEYSLLVRSTEWELLPVCREEGLALLAWSPLAGGWLTAKYRKGEAADPQSRVGRGERWDDQPAQRESDLAWNVIDRLREIAKSRGKTPTQVAINFLRRRSDLVVPIFGARTKDQLCENLGSVGWELTLEEMAVLEKASDTPLPYPYRFIERYTRRRESPELP